MKTNVIVSVELVIEHDNELAECTLKRIAFEDLLHCKLSGCSAEKGAYRVTEITRAFAKRASRKDEDA